MKTIILVRHAKSSWKDLSLDDFDRPLNKRGKRNAPFMGKELKKRQIMPDLILSSPAKRARKTAVAIAKAIDYPKKKIKYNENMYHTSASYLLEMVRNQDDAADIAQDVFLKAYEVLGTFKRRSSFHTWLYRIAVNFCINHLRRDKAKYYIELETYHAIQSPKALENIDTMELQDQLNNAINNLPEKQQTTVLLRVCDGLPYKEIAQILNCSIGTVKANYFHAVKNLRRLMKRYIVASA